MPIIVITNREFVASEDFLRILIVLTMRKLISQLITKLFGRRLLLPTFLSSGTEASGLINMLSLSRNLSDSYLEIGVENGLTLESVRIKCKIGVDPFPQFLSTVLTFHTKSKVMQSDFFFENNTSKYQIIYLDGLHTFEQTYRDFINSLSATSNDGFIIVDDTVPIDEYSALPDQSAAYEARRIGANSMETSWHGDVFKLISVISEWNVPFLELATISDLENPKTVMWLHDGYSWLEVLDKVVTVNSSVFTYHSEFHSGIPSKFFPITKNELSIKLSQAHKNISG